MSKFWHFCPFAARFCISPIPKKSPGVHPARVGQKLYLDALEGESVKVYIAVDTSGSVGDRELGNLSSG